MRAAVSSSSAGKENAYADHARAAVDPQDRAERTPLDVEVRIACPKLALGFGRVGGRIPIDHTQPLDRSKGDDQLDQSPQGAIHRAYPLDRGHLAVPNA